MNYRSLLAMVFGLLQCFDISAQRKHKKNSRVHPHDKVVRLRAPMGTRARMGMTCGEGPTDRSSNSPATQYDIPATVVEAVYTQWRSQRGGVPPCGNGMAAAIYLATPPGKQIVGPKGTVPNAAETATVLGVLCDVVVAAQS